MADETRQAAVETNNAATISKYGPEAWEQIKAQLLTDISVSLAMLVDNGSSSSAASAGSSET